MSLTHYDTYSKSYNTVIPLLQRDYVQGADENINKRDSFLSSILDCLAQLPDSSGKIPSGQMDFIYGSSIAETDAEGNPTSEKYFHPVDGQQRLTTLALIGWLLDNRFPTLDGEPRRKRHNLRYTSRNSSEQFCRHLMNHDIPKDCVDIRKHLLEEPMWFAEKWKNDPSVKAMLDLLAVADTMLSSPRYQPLGHKMAESFFNGSNLRFELLDMEEYGLTDDLYIKMNARGKHLTDFENWKAEFIDLLETEFPSEIYLNKQVNDVNLPLSEYFTYAIEHEWTDMLWDKAFSAWDAFDDKKKATQPYPTIDDNFLRILDFITQALFWEQYPESAYYSLNPSPKDTEAAAVNDRFAGNENIWLHARRLDMFKAKSDDGKPLNVVRLFNILDTLSDISKATNGDWETFFNSLLYNDNWHCNSDKINLFEKDRKVDLFSRCTENEEFNIPTAMLFWALINYCNKYSTTSPTKELLDFLRVIWGWELNKNSRNGVNHLEVASDLRVENYQQLGKVITLLLSDPVVSNSLSVTPNEDKWVTSELKEERFKLNLKKQGLETDINRILGCELLRGDISNLSKAMLSIRNSGNPGDFANRFHDFYKLSDGKKMRSLIAHGWKGERVSYDQCRFYGLHGHWEFIFSTSDPKFEKAISNLLTKQTPFSFSPDQKEFYMLKYPEFLHAHRQNWGEKESHLFYVKNNFYISTLLDSFSCRLPGYKESPYAFTAGKILAKTNKSLVDKLQLVDSYEEAGPGCLRFNYRDGKGYVYWLECAQEGWRFKFEDSKRWKKEWSSRFFIDHNGLWHDLQNNFKFIISPYDKTENILLDMPEKDRIESVILFLEALYNLI